MEYIKYFFRSSIEEKPMYMFSSIHIIILCIAIVGVLAILTMKKESRKLEIALGSTMLIQQGLLYSWYIIKFNQNLLTEGLPLYHCRIGILLIGIGLIFKKEYLIKIGAYWGIFTSVVALIFINLDSFLFPHITQFSYIIGHYCLLWGAVYILKIKKVGMNKKDFKNVLIFTNTYHIVMRFVNNFLGANYSYVKELPVDLGFKITSIGSTLIVILMFNIILTIEYKLINLKKKKRLNQQIDNIPEVA